MENATNLNDYFNINTLNNNLKFFKNFIEEINLTNNDDLLIRLRNIYYKINNLNEDIETLISCDNKKKYDLSDEDKSIEFFEKNIILPLLTIYSINSSNSSSN